MEEKTDYIFSINAGRSGSGYICNIFKNVTSCRSFHEPAPTGNGKVMRRYARGHLKPMRSLAKDKVRVIWEQTRDGDVYCETNHCFIKGFGWFIPEFIAEDRIGVIILKRNKSAIANSLLRIGCSPLTSLGREWISLPDMKSPLVKPPTTVTRFRYARFARLAFRAGRYLVKKIAKIKLDYPRRLAQYELKCLNWYVEETYAKAEAFKNKYPAAKYYEVNIEDLNSLEAVQQMLAYFGCTETQSLTDVVGKPTNLKRRPG